MYSTGEHTSVHQNVHGDEVRGCWGENLVSGLVLLASKTEMSIFIEACLYILKGSRNTLAFKILFFRIRFNDNRRSPALPVCPDVDCNLCPPTQVEASETRETLHLVGDLSKSEAICFNSLEPRRNLNDVHIVCVGCVYFFFQIEHRNLPH